MKVNELRRRLASGQTVVGSFIYLPSAKLAEIFGLAGFDFVVIDTEHGPIDTAIAEDMVRACEVAGVTPLLRVAHNTPHLILRGLDLGAYGVHVPDVNTFGDAKQAADACKYGPEGQRGMAGVRAGNYGFKETLAEYAAMANRETMVVVHVESAEAVENLDDLLREKRIDVYYVGPEDMANSLGIPGQSKDPRVVRLVEDAIRRIAAAGRVAGCVAADTTTARRWIELGARYIGCHPLRFMMQAAQKFLSEVRS